VPGAYAAGPKKTSLPTVTARAPSATATPTASAPVCRRTGARSVLETPTTQRELTTGARQTETNSGGGSPATVNATSRSGPASQLERRRLKTATSSARSPWQ
jgi:hypothetical protein